MPIARIQLAVTFVHVEMVSLALVKCVRILMSVGIRHFVLVPICFALTRLEVPNVRAKMAFNKMEMNVTQPQHQVFVLMLVAVRMLNVLPLAK